MKSIDELNRINCECIKDVAKAVDIKAINIIHAKMIVLKKTLDILFAIAHAQQSPEMYEKGMIKRLQASGERMSSALDSLLQGDISRECKNEIKAAKSECTALIREFKKAK